MKKLLAIILALVLPLSALPFAGAFTDDAGIDGKYKTAVAETSEKKIIGGFPDGSFKPLGTLTRAQAAKILCVMLEGSEKADALTKLDTGFADVPASHWAAKFVAYCVDKGIVAGVGGGRFDPDGTLSAAAFAKMLLVAYGADSSKFTGDGWLAAVAEAAPTIFLDNLIEDFSARTLPRQEAAQMAYNALCCAEATAAKDDKDLSGSLPTSVPEKLSVLAIGNSGSNDCVLNHLWELLTDAGVKEFTIGNMYRSSCLLQMHAQYAVGHEKGYQYYKRTQSDKKWKSTKKYDTELDVPLEEQQWDFITFQQGNGKVGIESSYHPYQDILLHYVQVRQPKAVFGWNLNWSLQDGMSKRDFFTEQYGRSQMKMYETIIRSTKNQVLPEKRYQFVIPVGTAIQNARGSYLGDTLNRDGQHLDKGIGRYIAAMTWCCKLTGVDPEKLTYAPAGVTAGQIAVAKESVKNALAHPYEITQSQYTTAP